MTSTSAWSVLRWFEGGLLATIKEHDLEIVLFLFHLSWYYAGVAGALTVSVSIGAMRSDQHIVWNFDGLVSSARKIP